jgi:AcrR family transcriptional regulator
MKSEMGTKTSPQEPQVAGPDDLRERKRTRTRLMIQAEAFRLFASKGYADTTVEEIADAAAISARTFFRYFPTKEDVVLWDEYDPLMPQLLDARPLDEPPAATARAVMRESLGGIYRRDPEQLLARVRLFQSVPELRARFLGNLDRGGEMFASLLVQRLDRHVDELKARVVATALGAAVTAALDVWQRGDGKDDLLAVFDQATDSLVDGFRELERTDPG